MILKAEGLGEVCIPPRDVDGEETDAFLELSVAPSDALGLRSPVNMLNEGV